MFFYFGFSMRLFFLLFLTLFSLSYNAGAQSDGRYEVVIDEIMADPTPSAGLPEAEYIEIKNISGKAIDLSGWKLATTSRASSPFPAYLLPADSFLILCTSSHVPDFDHYGKTLGIAGFPSITNNGNTLSLTNREGKVIHAIQYNMEWYQNNEKEKGGWSLEMIDTHNPCSGISNWTASVHPDGGTPGKRNSVDGVNDDTQPPQLIRTFSIDSMTIMAVFNEPLDSLSAAVASSYILEDINSIRVLKAIPVGPIFDQVVLKLSDSLHKRKVYQLSVYNVTDCKGNTVGIVNHAPAGLSAEAADKDIVINEILFNPRPGASDYIELYNRSDKIIDTRSLSISSRNVSGNITNTKKISDQPFFVYPGGYMVVTKDVLSLSKEYFVKEPGYVLLLPSLPSFPDDKGTVVITDAQEKIIDEVSYSDKWHFQLITNTEGVSLERIDPDGPSQDQNNWHSAASTAGYGTPTYKNSQYGKDKANLMIDVSPGLFSPDNDGNEDFASISFHADQPGYMANIYIFDANGRMVRYLIRNELLGISGHWTWDGLGENGQKLSVGHYIIFTQLFNLEGKKIQFKNVIGLVRRK